MMFPTPLRRITAEKGDDHNAFLAIIGRAIAKEMPYDTEIQIHVKIKTT